MYMGFFFHRFFFSTIFLCTFRSFSHTYLRSENAQWKIKLKIFMQLCVYIVDLMISDDVIKMCETFYREHGKY